MSNITAAQLQPILTAWQAALNALNALIVAANTSSPGTRIDGPNSVGTITDAQGNVWQMGGASPVGQFYNVRNGANDGQAEYLIIDTVGVVWGYFPANGWWQYNGNGGWNQKYSVGPVTS